MVSQSLPAARVLSLQTRPKPRLPSKYVPQLVDAIFVDVSSEPLAVPPYFKGTHPEATQFTSSLHSLREVDMAVAVNASMFVAKLAGAIVQRTNLGEHVIHCISKSNRNFNVVCIEPQVSFEEEFQFILGCSLVGSFSRLLLEFAADQNLTFFAATDYERWIFYRLFLENGTVSVEVKAVHQSCTRPSVRSVIFSALCLYSDDQLELQETLAHRRELGRYLETIKSEDHFMYPRFVCPALPMSRRRPDDQLLNPLICASRDKRIVDFLHDDIKVNPLFQYGSKSRLVSIRENRVVLQTFSSITTWKKVMTIYTKKLSMVQGTCLPFFYLASISDPFRDRGKRQLGILVEHIQGILLHVWLDAPFAPLVPIETAMKQIRTNCVKTLEKVHSFSIANGSIADSFVVNPLDLTVCLVKWDAATLGGGFEKDYRQLERLFDRCKFKKLP